MIWKNSQYLSNSLTYVYKPEIGERIKYTANTGVVLISTANSNLDGTGTLGTVISCTTANGTIIKSLTIKAIGNTTRGMIRFFIDGPLSTKRLVAEIEVPAVIADSVDQAFSFTMDMNFWLENNKELYASTQNAESFVITAEGLDVSFP